VHHQAHIAGVDAHAFVRVLGVGVVISKSDFAPQGEASFSHRIRGHANLTTRGRGARTKCDGGGDDLDLPARKLGLNLLLHARAEVGVEGEGRDACKGK
jgi:hypothetical protein